METFGETARLWVIGLLPWVGLLGVVVLIDLVGGVGLAWARGTFDLEKLPRFLVTAVLFGWAWVTVELIFFLPGALGIEVDGLLDLFAGLTPKAVYALVVVKYATSIYKNVGAILRMDAWEESVKSGLQH
jgi:hypothetical protein